MSETTKMLQCDHCKHIFPYQVFASACPNCRREKLNLVSGDSLPPEKKPEKIPLITEIEKYRVHDEKAAKPTEFIATEDKERIRSKPRMPVELITDDISQGIIQQLKKERIELIVDTDSLPKDGRFSREKIELLSDSSRILPPKNKRDGWKMSEKSLSPSKDSDLTAATPAQEVEPVERITKKSARDEPAAFSSTPIAPPSLPTAESVSEDIDTKDTMEAPVFAATKEAESEDTTKDLADEATKEMESDDNLVKSSKKRGKEREATMDSEEKQEDTQALDEENVEEAETSRESEDNQEEPLSREERRKRRKEREKSRDAQDEGDVAQSREERRKRRKEREKEREQEGDSQDEQEETSLSSREERRKRRKERENGKESPESDDSGESDESETSSRERGRRSRRNREDEDDEARAERRRRRKERQAEEGDEASERRERRRKERRGEAEEDSSEEKEGASEEEPKSTVSRFARKERLLAATTMSTEPEDTGKGRFGKKGKKSAATSQTSDDPTGELEPEGGKTRGFKKKAKVDEDAPPTYLPRVRPRYFVDEDEEETEEKE